jgi:predicted DCC family thiol-disulfide oxidoreductase YuxK
MGTANIKSMSHTQEKKGQQNSVLLYDGICGFCNHAIQFILKHDSSGSIRFAPLQSRLGKEILARHPELEGIDSMVFIEQDKKRGAENAYVRSTAVLKLAPYCGGIYRLASIGHLIPLKLRDALYRLFAQYRYSLFGKQDTCPLPDASQRARFLDL